MSDLFVQRFQKNADGIDFVVGDIHGRFDELLSALQEKGFNFEIDRLFSVGDLVDRGEQHKEVVELINEPWFYPVRGNHDQFIIDQFDDERVLLFRYREYSPKEIHVKLEGKWFAELGEHQQQWFYHQLKDLPYLIEVETEKGRVGICHAGLPRYVSDWNELVNQLHNRDIREQVMRTRRSPKEQKTITGIDLTVHGHTCFEGLHQNENAFFIDTFDKTGSLTIIEILDLFGSFQKG